MFYDFHGFAHHKLSNHCKCRCEAAFLVFAAAAISICAFESPNRIEDCRGRGEHPPSQRQLYENVTLSNYSQFLDLVHNHPTFAV